MRSRLTSTRSSSRRNAEVRRAEPSATTRPPPSSGTMHSPGSRDPRRVHHLSTGNLRWTGFEAGQNIHAAASVRGVHTRSRYLDSPFRWSFAASPEHSETPDPTNGASATLGVRKLRLGGSARFIEGRNDTSRRRCPNRYGNYLLAGDPIGNTVDGGTDAGHRSRARRLGGIDHRHRSPLGRRRFIAFPSACRIRRYGAGRISWIDPVRRLPHPAPCGKPGWPNYSRSTKADRSIAASALLE